MIGGCPRCKNKHFKKTDDRPFPVVTYKTLHFPDKNGRITQRYKSCLQCGHNFVTEEKYLRDVQKDPELFEDGN